MKAELIDYMGDDLTVVNAARVSFDKESEFDEGDLRLGDQKLINYLASNGHWTPFSHVMVQMRETVPIFVARQRFKHMVGFTYNEVSRRYVNDTPEFYHPKIWRKAAENKKQGSSDEAVDPETFSNQATYHSVLSQVMDLYSDMINAGVAPEQARMVLPQSMYTSYYVTGSLAAWARAYKLRSDPHAQLEIQELASQWNEIISSIPEMRYSWSALVS